MEQREAYEDFEINVVIQQNANDLFVRTMITRIPPNPGAAISSVNEFRIEQTTLDSEKAFAHAFAQAKGEIDSWKRTGIVKSF